MMYVLIYSSQNKGEQQKGPSKLPQSGFFEVEDAKRLRKCMEYIQKRFSEAEFLLFKKTKKVCSIRDGILTFKLICIHKEHELPPKINKAKQRILLRGFLIRYCPNMIIAPHVKPKFYRGLKLVLDDGRVVQWLRKNGYGIKVIPYLEPDNEQTLDNLKLHYCENMERELEKVIEKIRSTKVSKNITRKELKRLILERNKLRLLKEKIQILKKMFKVDYTKKYNSVYVRLTQQIKMMKETLSPI